MKKENKIDALNNHICGKHRTEVELSDINEITRLESLLESRRTEYEIFGITGEDAAQDIEIRNKINVLKQSLKL